mgnify:CR=1 FL=1
MVGSDTWVNSRWDDYEALMQQARRWLGDLPPAVAPRIAWDNGASWFGLPAPERNGPRPRPRQAAASSDLKHRRSAAGAGWNARLQRRMAIACDRPAARRRALSRILS